MGIKRIVDVNFWTDDKVIDLFTPEDKLFMLYLLTNPHTKQLGIYQINKKVMAFELGYSKEAIEVLLDRFQTKYGLIVYSEETQEIAIKNYLKYSIIKGGKPVEDLLIKDMSIVKNRKLLKFIINHLKENKEGLNVTVLKLLNDNDNDNDNDNEVSYHDSYHDSLKQRSQAKKSTFPQSDKNLFLDVVKLKNEEYNKLITELGQKKADEYIQRLNDYVASTGKKYKSHYHTIKSWVRRDQDKVPENIKAGASTRDLNQFVQ